MSRRRLFSCGHLAYLNGSDRTKLTQTAEVPTQKGESDGSRGKPMAVIAFRDDANRIKLSSVFVVASQRDDRQGTATHEIELYLILRNENHVT